METIVVWFSCGAASAVAAKLALDKYKDKACVVIVNNPIKEELEDNRRFLKDVESWLDYPIVVSSNSDYPASSAVDVWYKEKYVNGPKGATCTRLLKRGARLELERNIPDDIDWHVFGFTLDEKKRSDRFILGERSNVLPLLIDAKITKEDCYQILTSEGLRLPESYHLGYPNANCIGCPKATSPTYWNHVRKKHPDVFAERVKQFDDLGVKVVRYKGERIPLSSLPLDAKGYSLKSMKSVDCGIFCEEKVS